jgi:hypothetical protein
VCEEPCVAELEWQERIAGQARWTGKFLVLPPSQTPAHLGFAPNAAQHVVISSQRIRKELGYAEIISQDVAIQQTISWELANPPKTVDPAKFDYAAEDAALDYRA